MPVAIVQQKTGGFTGLTGTATLDAGATAGNTIVIVLGDTANLSTPSGFTISAAPSLAPPATQVYHKSNVSAGESSWALTSGSALDLVSWIAFEVEGLDPDFPVDVTSNQQQTNSSVGTTITTPTNGLSESTTYDGWVVASFAAMDTTSSTAPTWSSYTNSFDEVVESGYGDVVQG